MGRRSVDIIGKLDWLTVLLVLCIMVCGWFSICGASANVENVDLFSFSTRPGKQMVWIFLSFVLGGIIMLFNQNTLSSYAYVVYIALLLLLVITIFVAGDTKGSHSWLSLGPVKLQPAEFSKFATALALAKYVDRYDFNANDPKDLFRACGIFLLPMVFIVLQNETGSALVYLAFLLVLFREGMTGSVLLTGFCAILFFILEIKYSPVSFGEQPFKLGTWLVLTIVQLVEALMVRIMSNDKKFALGIFLVGVVGMLVGLAFSLSIFAFNVTYLQVLLIIITSAHIIFRAFKDMARRYIWIAVFALGSVGFLFSVDYAFNEILQPHQRTRINVILGLEDDPKGAGYNVNQSLIAIGSGGFTGKGFMKGTQTKLKYVPEQDTDFIFCTVGEEQGFIGSVFVLLLYLGLLLRLIVLAERQASVFGRVYGYSVISILLFHLFINIGMVLGITPVIGIPLPFFSYGGSSLWGFTILLAMFLRIDCERSANY
ncbi:MAG: rod shape-determining protein RodA [Bacteroidaceae bacterium]|nr:rod shape-determining protein RodA [Bacteroidaceae bacterium]